MPSSDRTRDFRDVMREKEREFPDAKRRKLAKFIQHESGRDGEVHIGKEYIREAYVILNHINTLTQMLANIRKPYLSVDSWNAPLVRQASRTLDLKDSDPLWAGIRHLTNEERDQIDMQARVILTRCADRVKEMEALEKRRAELVARKTNPLARLLPARLRQDSSTMSSDFLAAHHSSITWYLSRRLAEASQSQKEMQEERVKRQLERTRTLGSGATREILNMGTKITSSFAEESRNSGGNWLSDASTSLLAAAIGVPSSDDPHYTLTSSNNTLLPSEDEDDEIELSASQILQFETENANILRTVQDTLESVQQAESRLLDISALQMELVTHLARQTELTDQLYEDAIATTSTVDKGNTQLKEAQRRAKDDRVFILVFLIGASLSLLFLHYY